MPFSLTRPFTHAHSEPFIVISVPSRYYNSNKRDFHFSALFIQKMLRHCSKCVNTIVCQVGSKCHNFYDIFNFFSGFFFRLHFSGFSFYVLLSLPPFLVFLFVVYRVKHCSHKVIVPFTVFIIRHCYNDCGFV